MPSPPAQPMNDLTMAAHYFESGNVGQAGRGTLWVRRVVNPPAPWDNP